MKNFFRTLKISHFLSFILNGFKQNKAGITAVEYAIVVAGVISVMVLICLGSDSPMSKLFSNIFNTATSEILSNLTHFISFN